MIRIGKTGLVGGLIALGALAIPVATVAHTSKTSSELTLATFEDPEYTLLNGVDADDSFSGQVDSGKASCKKGRTVKLFRSAADPILVDDDETDNAGNWAVFAEDPGDGTYFAKVSKKRTGSGNHKHICKPDKSPNLVVDDFVGPADADEDGSFVGPDCDDGNAAINPSGTETRDGVDQDCDGLADDLDADADGFITGDDCDDADNGRNPDATEVANGIDDDCDGAGDAGSADVDGDGVSGATDCDDTDSSVSPGVAETRDGVDDDCDGKADDIDADVDGVSTPEDCNDTTSNVSPQATETQDGTDEDCDGTSDEDF